MASEAESDQVQVAAEGEVEADEKEPAEVEHIGCI